MWFGHWIGLGLRSMTEDSLPLLTDIIAYVASHSDNIVSVRK